MSNPNFDMKAIFDYVSDTSLKDKEQMLLLRFFQNIDTFYVKVRDCLLESKGFADRIMHCKETL